MIEEPYRWLEAVANRREYVQEHLKSGSPVFAAALPDGILLVGIGSGQSKVFELFDRHAFAALGHPADIEKIRQAAIDAAHMEAFTRAPEDVSLRRLVSYGLSPQLKQNFEQIFSAPFLVELLLAELGCDAGQDLFLRLHFDGSFESRNGGIVIAAGRPDGEAAAQKWLTENFKAGSDRAAVADLLLQCWWCLIQPKGFSEPVPGEDERRAGWRAELKDKTVEIGWLARKSPRPAHYQSLTLENIGL